MSKTTIQIPQEVGEPLVVTGDEEFIRKLALDIILRRHDSAEPAESKKTNKVYEFRNVFAIKNGELKIICNIPGMNKQEKMQNIALIFLYGKMLIGIEDVRNVEIRRICFEHQCLDSNNFSYAMRNFEEEISSSGHKGNRRLSLTSLGKKNAEILVQQLNDIERIDRLAEK